MLKDGDNEEATSMLLRAEADASARSAPYRARRAPRRARRSTA